MASIIEVANGQSKQKRALPVHFDPVAAIEVTTEIARTMSRWMAFVTFVFGLALSAILKGQWPPFHHWFIAGTVALGVMGIVYIYFYYLLAIDSIAPIVESITASRKTEVHEDDWEDDDEPAVTHRIIETPLPVLEWLDENVAADWYEKVDWTRLAEKVVLSGAGFSRDSLSPEVPHFVYSLRPGDEGPTFPEEMMRLGLARPDSGGYKWTSFGKNKWSVLLSETDRSPLPYSNIGE